MLALIEEADPKLYAELVELRGSNPQAYRKRIRKLGEHYVIRSPQKLMANRSAMWHASQRDEVDVLDEHYQIVRAAVKRGYWDERLDELRAAEKQGRDRPVIYQILDERAEWLAYAASAKPPMPPSGGNWVRTPPKKEPDE
ncbi:MAG: hypothetical protein R3F61_18595 [Myxococcota bacterium]